MNQKYLVLKATEHGERDGGTEYVCVAEILCERSDARQRAKDVIEEDGTFYCVPLGDKIVANTTRVFEGVKPARAKSPANDKPATKKTKKRGLNPEVKVKTASETLEA